LSRLLFLKHSLSVLRQLVEIDWNGQDLAIAVSSYLVDVLDCVRQLSRQPESALLAVEGFDLFVLLFVLAAFEDGLDNGLLLR